MYYNVPDVSIYDIGIERICQDDEMLHTDVHLYVRLINLCRKDPRGFIRMSGRAISRASHISPRVVIDALPKLRDAGYINAVETKRGWIVSLRQPPSLPPSGPKPPRKPRFPKVPAKKPRKNT